MGCRHGCLKKEVAGEKFGNNRKKATGDWETCVIRSSIICSHGSNIKIT
jgi:hypothetical protein